MRGIPVPPFGYHASVPKTVRKSRLKRRERVEAPKHKGIGGSKVTPWQTILGELPSWLPRPGIFSFPQVFLA